MQRQLPDVSAVHGGAAAETGDFFDGELPSRRDPIRWLVSCRRLLLIAAIAIGTAIMVGNFRDHAIESSKRELENTVLLLAHHFDQQLDDAEIPLKDLIAQIHQAGIASPDDFKRQLSTPETHLTLKAKVGGASKFAGVNVYDADGDLISSSEVPVVPAVNIADRAYFNALKTSPEVAQPQIELVRSRFTGGWKTLITRRVTGQNGEFLGVVSRAIAPAKFEEFFSSVALGKDSAIIMHHRDGALVARYPHVEEFIGRNFKTGSTPQAALLSRDHGTMRLISPVDGEERLVSVHSLSRFPLSVVATTTVASALAEWRAQTKFLIVVAGLSAIIISIDSGPDRSAAVVAASIVAASTDIGKATPRHRRQQYDAGADAVRSIQTAHCLQPAIYRDVRVVARCGETRLQLRDLIAHRNEFGLLQGDVDEYCSRILEHVALREKPSPLILRMDVQFRSRTALLSDGGWVATHEDITERIRHETDVFQQATELARINMQFDAALSNMAQGLCMFDGQKRLVVWNERYAELYQVPPDLLKIGTPYEAIVSRSHLAAAS